MNYEPAFDPKQYLSQASNQELGFFDKMRVNGLEFLVIIFSVIAVIGVGIFGFSVQEAVNRDKQRTFDMENIMLPALLDFYKNSGAVENSRLYPISRCSGDLNEVDYEFTLRQNLTGRLPEVDNHTYIDQNNYPKDKSGQYSDNFKDRKVNYRCPEKLNFSTVQSGGQIYPDYASCNFSRSQNLRKCYLYTSTANGDTFQLGYYSESKNCFVVYTQFRSDNLKSRQECGV
jgi:ABC-type antimicrobial peptide transport system permease subunit